MAENVSPPNLQETETLLETLLNEVQTHQGHLHGGTALTLGVADVKKLMQTKIEFTNPRDNLVAITPEVLEQTGLELIPVRKQQLTGTHNFYYLTLNVNMRPEPGAQFKALRCQLDLGPKGPKEPIVQAIFPKQKWRPVMEWGGGMNLGLDSNLEWTMGVDASQVTKIAQLPAELKAQVANKNELKSFIVIPNYAYELGRYDIAAYGEGGSECFWDIQDPDLQKISQAQFGLVFKVPKGTEAIELEGIAWAEPDMSWLTTNFRNVLRSLSERLQALLKQKDKAASHFSRGAAEKWNLSLV